MKVLVACEESQRVCIAFREKGHEAYSCDIQDCSGGHPEWHIKGNVLHILSPVRYTAHNTYKGHICFRTMDGEFHDIEKWDLIIAHPPCTYLTNTGNPYLNVDKYGEKAIERYKNREEAFEFFMRFVNADCERIAIENPIGYVSSRYRKPNQIIQPYHFGEPFTKATCLWLKRLPCLIPKYKEKPVDCKSYARETMYDENGKTISWSSNLSKKLRSKTFEGIAKAMAEQWGK